MPGEREARGKGHPIGEVSTRSSRNGFPSPRGVPPLGREGQMFPSVKHIDDGSYPLNKNTMRKTA
jgi:hypothetical protein